MDDIVGFNLSSFSQKVKNTVILISNKRKGLGNELREAYTAKGISLPDMMKRRNRG